MPAPSWTVRDERLLKGRWRGGRQTLTNNPIRFRLPGGCRLDVL